MVNKYYVGDVGTEILLETGITLTGASNTKIKCRKPDGTLVEWAAAVKNTTQLTYTTIVGDFNQAGMYEVQASMTIGGWSGLGEAASFEVFSSYTPTYCSAANVASLLRLIVPTTQARKIFDSTTDPTLAEVENYIREAEDVIDKETNHAWRAAVVTNEYHNVGRLYTGFYRRELPIKLKHRSIRPVVSGTDKIELWDGANWVDLVLAANGYTEGRNADYWIDYTSGIVYFVSLKPYYAEKGVRMTYRFGETSIPYDIQEAATKLAACKILENEDYKLVLPEGVSQYGIMSKVESWKKDIARILENHREHFSAV